MKILIADLETDNFLSDLTRIWCLGVGDPVTGNVVVYADQPGYLPVEQGLARLRDADRIVMHNGIGFDLPAFEKLHPGVIHREQVWDSLVVSRLLFPDEREHSLEAWGRRLGFLKGEHKDFTQFSKEMADYCGIDIEVTIKLYKLLQRTLKKHLAEGTDWREAIRLEFDVAHVIALQEQHGFRLDVRKAVDLEGELRQEVDDLARQCRAAFGPAYVPAKGSWDWNKRTWTHVEVTTPKKSRRMKSEHGPVQYVAGAPYTKVELESFNPNSRAQIVYRFSNMYGWRPAKFTDAGTPATDEDVIAELDYPEAKLLHRSLRVTKQLGQIADGENGWLKLVTPAGYVHGRVNTLGAVTHRMTHFAPNMAQVDKKDKRMRQVWLADEGDDLTGCDAEGLELRMLAHFLAAYDGGAYAQSVVSGTKEDGTDVHSRTKGIVGLHSRDSAKTVIYAFLYGSGDANLGRIILEDARAGGSSLKGAPSTVGKNARNRLETGITGLDRLVGLCKKRAKEQGWLKGLDGRRVMIRSQHSALNTALQGAGALVMKKALQIFHYELLPQHGLQKIVKYCANVHDEVQMSVPPAHSEQVGKLFAEAIRLAGERLNLRCPLAGSYDIGKNWGDTH